MPLRLGICSSLPKTEFRSAYCIISPLFCPVDCLWNSIVTCLRKRNPTMAPNVTCLVSLSLYVTSFLLQCTLLGFFWHQLVTSGFPWQLMMDTCIWCSVVYSTADAASLLHFTCSHKITVNNETWTRLTARSRSLLTASSLLAYCFDCLLLHCLVDSSHWSDCFDCFLFFSLLWFDSLLVSDLPMSEMLSALK
jgi:hypothetical protein